MTEPTDTSTDSTDSDSTDTSAAAPTGPTASDTAASDTAATDTSTTSPTTATDATPATDASSAGQTAEGAATGVAAGPPQAAPPVQASSPRSATGLDPTETMVGSANGVGLWVGPPGTPLPEAGTAFAAPWKPLGYASDDGVTLGGDTTSEAITPWQSTTPIRTIITEKSRTIGFTMWQLNQNTLGVYFDQEIAPADGDGVYEFDVSSSGGGAIRAVAVDAKDGDNAIRIGFGRATLDSTGDMVLQKGAIVPLEVTLSALDDAGRLCRVQIKSGSGAVEEYEIDAERVAA